MIKFPKTPRLAKVLEEGSIYKEWKHYSAAVTEKVDGCVIKTTSVTMADGTRKKITKVSIGDEVLGVENGKVVVTKVLNVFNNGLSPNGWMNITGNLVNAGPGPSYFSLTCTPNHRLWDPSVGNYVQVSDLKPGNKVVVFHSQPIITPIQEQVLLGKMLGDGHISQNNVSARVTWNHSEKDAEYSEWTARALGDLDSGTIDYPISGFGSNMVRRRTTNRVGIKKKFESFISDGKKIVPSWVEFELTPIALAFWFMDDGSLQHTEGQEDRATISTCAFTYEDCHVLIRALQRLGVGAVYYEDKKKGYPYLRINSDDAERLFLLIAPYVPPSMQRKLPERYRGHPGWLPNTSITYKPTLVEQVIEIVKICETINQQYRRYDIETETHNYFANGILVHNSNTGISFDSDGNLLLQSRGHYLVGGPRERQFDLFKQWSNQNIDYLFGVLGDKYILFGEWCYAKHLIFYDNLPNYFLGFDIYDKENEKFLSLTRYQKVLGDGPVTSVPLLYQNTFGKINNFGQYIGNTSLKTKDWKDKLIQIAGEKELEHTDPTDLMEGIYVRIEDDDWVIGRMKNPRAAFSKIVDEDTHWMTRPILPNQLRL